MSGGAKSAASNKLDQDIAVALGKLDSSLHKQKSGGAQSASKKLDQVRTVTLNPYNLNPEPGTLDPGPLCLNHGRRTLILKPRKLDQDISDALGRLSSSSKGLAQAIGQSEEHSKSCSVLQVGVCRDQCKSKINLDMGAKSMQECMPDCLGDCAEEFGFKTSNLEKAAIGVIQKADAKLIQKVEDEVVSAATGQKASAALSREDKRQADSIAQGALARLANKVQQSQLQPQAAGAISSFGGSRLLPADVVQPAGTPTGIYDCRGADILVGSVVGRMVGGQPCEDRMLLVTAGKWQVSGVGPMGSGGGDGFTDDRTARAEAGAEKVDVVLKGISPDVNMGTRLNFEPVKGAMTDWKIIEGETNDLFLPENVRKLRAIGGANQV